MAPFTLHLPMTGGPLLAKRRDPKVPASSRYTFQQLRALWEGAGGPGGSVSVTAAAIALAESGGNPTIVNSIGATGLWQIHPGGRQYLEPHANARAAVAKYRGAGNKFTPWTTFTGYDTPGHAKTYLNFMPKQGLPGTAATDVVKDAADAATAIPQFIGKVGSVVFDPDWWLRVALIVMGLAAMAAGVVYVGKGFATSQATTVAKTVFQAKGK